MSGAGRKHRAKHLTQQYLDVTGWVGPRDGETLAVCLESPHGQHVRVLMLLAGQGTSPEATPPVQDAAAAASASPPAGAEVEQLVHLPRKFHKVIWLSIKDIVVIADGAVGFKPSPEQLENFLKDAKNAGWRERIAAAQQRAEEQRVALQRMPQYGATAQTTTSVLTGPQVRPDARAADGAAEANADDPGSASGSGDDIDDLVNPNWRNIKHQQQFFYDDDDDSDGDEAADDEEEAEEEAEARA